MRRTHSQQGAPAQHRLPRRQVDRIPAVHRDEVEPGHLLRMRDWREPHTGTLEDNTSRHIQLSEDY